MPKNKRSLKLTIFHFGLGNGLTQSVMEFEIISLLFFVLFFFYLWQVVDLRLIYCVGETTDFPVFFKGWAFLKAQMVRPGGLVMYLSALLSQFFYYSWAGALIVMLQAWALASCIGYLLKSVGVPGSRWLRFFAPVLVLVTYNQYSYHFPTTQALLTALLFASLYIAIVSLRGAKSCDAAQPIKSFDGRAIVVFLVLSIIVYVLAAGAYLVFGVICIIYESFFRFRLVGLSALAIVLLLPYLAATWLYHFRVVDAYTELLPISWKILDSRTRMHMIGAVYALYLMAPAAMLIWRLGDPLLRRLRASPADHRSKKTSEPQHRNGPTKPAGPIMRRARRHARSFAAIRWTAQLLITLGLGAAVAVVSHNSQKKTLLAVHNYACRRMWPEVLQVATGQPANPLVLSAVNRALYHTGQLETDMFYWPQRPDALLPTGDDKDLMYWNKFDTLIDLGLINLAEKNLTECMETFGEHPMLLQRLALINMAKGRIETARVFLGALNRTFFYSAWAKYYLKLLKSDPSLSTDPQIRQMRAVDLKTDSTAAFFDKEKMLTALLQDNSRNRMAFEYLMAWYLVTKRVEKVAEGVHYMSDLHYAEIPRLYQQAICIYAYSQRKPIQLFGRTIDPRVRQQIELFSQTFNRYKRDKRAAFPELAATYGGSYFLYHIYGLVPME